MIRCRNNRGEPVELPLSRFIYRPSVYAVFRRGGRVLICRTRSTGKLWLPGGGMEEGESHEQALRREVKEEAGIGEMRIVRFLGQLRNYCYYAPTDEACDAHLFFYECATTETRVAANDEIEDGEAIDFAWMPLEQVLGEEFTDASEGIHAILSQLGGALDLSGGDGMLG